MFGLSEQSKARPRYHFLAVYVQPVERPRFGGAFYVWGGPQAFFGSFYIDTSFANLIPESGMRFELETPGEFFSFVAGTMRIMPVWVWL